MRGMYDRNAHGIEGMGWPDHSRYETTVSLISKDASLYFTATISFWIWWDGVEQAPPAWKDIAGTSIIQRAEKISEQYRLTAAERMRAEVNTALVRWDQSNLRPLRVRGHCVSVEVAPEDLAAVQEDEQSFQQHVIRSWYEQRRQHELEQMCSLLRDPLRATAWWLLNNPDTPPNVVPIAQQFQELRNLLALEEREEQAEPESPGALVDELLNTSNGSVHTRMVHMLERCFSGYGRDDLANRLQTGIE